MPSQRTKLRNIQYELSNYLLIPLRGPWKIKSLSIISLLLGFYLSSNISSYFINKQGERIGVLIILLFAIEFLIRIRPKTNFKDMPFYWMIIDNFRIGTTYAIVLEAFKLGS